MIHTKHWWRLWSIRLAAVAGVIAAVLSASPSILIWLINELLPSGPWRLIVSLLIGLVVFVIPAAARLIPQKKLVHLDAA